MTVSRNSIASAKTVSSWATQIRKDIQIERDTIELNLGTRAKGSKKGAFKAPTKTQFISASLNSSGLQNVKSKNSRVCSMALQVLSLLIPSLDPASHKVRPIWSRGKLFKYFCTIYLCSLRGISVSDDIPTPWIHCS